MMSLMQEIVTLCPELQGRRIGKVTLATLRSNVTDALQMLQRLLDRNQGETLCAAGCRIRIKELRVCIARIESGEIR